MNIDPHLAELRRVKSLRLGGMSYNKIGQRVGVTGPTAKKMIAEANALRLKGLLFADINSEADDMFEIASIPRRKHTLHMNGARVE